MTDLTIDLTEEDLVAMIDYCTDNGRFKEVLLPVRVMKQLLDTMQREAKLREALETIRCWHIPLKHDQDDLIADDIRQIADNALNASEYSVNKDGK